MSQPSLVLKSGTGHKPTRTLPEISRYEDYQAVYSAEVDSLEEDNSTLLGNVEPPPPMANDGSQGSNSPLAAGKTAAATKQAKYGKTTMSPAAHEAALNQPARNTKQTN